MEIATALAHKGYYMSHPCRVWGFQPNSTIEAFLDDLVMLDGNPAVGGVGNSRTGRTWQ